MDPRYEKASVEPVDMDWRSRKDIIVRTRGRGGGAAAAAAAHRPPPGARVM
jgi:hypothetical protein